MEHRGFFRSRMGPRTLIALPLVALCAVAYAATLCYTDNTSVPIIKGIQNGSGEAASFSVTSSTNANPALCVNNAGAGTAATLTNTSASNSNAALSTSTSGTGQVGSFTSTNTGSYASAVKAIHQGLGEAGEFDINNLSNYYPALSAMTNGTGQAGNFTVNNPNSSSHALYCTTNSLTGTSGYFEMTSGSMGCGHGLEATNNGGSLSAAMYAWNSGKGYAGYYVNNNSMSASDVLYAENHGASPGSAVHGANYGTGAAVAGVNYSTGYAGLFENISSSSTTDVLYAESHGMNNGMISGAAVAGVNYGTNFAGRFQNGNPNSTTDVLYTTAGSSTALAGDFNGPVSVHGSFTTNNYPKSFRIDDPLDPANKYLIHACVEGPDMTNFYRGNVTTDSTGTAVVQLPPYFDALNRDPTYTLTAVGQPSQPYVAQEITNNQFVIKTTLPNAKVSWVVTGLRQDVWANAHPMQVEVPKPAGEVGTYLDPVDWGQPESKGLYYIKDHTLPGPPARPAQPQSAARHAMPFGPIRLPRARARFGTVR